jgi:hypothetical protein
MRAGLGIEGLQAAVRACQSLVGWQWARRLADGLLATIYGWGRRHALVFPVPALGL